VITRYDAVGDPTWRLASKLCSTWMCTMVGNLKRSYLTNL